MTPKKVTGIILAGGKSSRMGQDKSLILWEGKSLLAHVIQSLKSTVEEVIIITNNPAHEGFGAKCYVDLIADQGPLGGLYTGLFYSATEANIVLSCDVPLVSGALLRHLLFSIEESVDVAYFIEEGQEHPLVACYQKRVLPIVKEQLMKNERSMKALLRQLRVQTIEVPEKHQKELLNINTLDDLRLLSKK